MSTQLRERDFGLGGYAQETRVIACPIGTTEADFERPEFWAAVQRHLKPWSRYHMRAEDGSFYIEYVVVGVENGLPILRRLCGFVDEEATAEPDEVRGVRIEFVNEREGYRVVRVADGYVIKDKLREKREARRQRTLYLDPPAKRSAA